ncbi:MAG: prepilin-type N-terminal cleavage/methylation domain-containing protein [bacterium]|jgi:type II secretion system protein G|nr:prepilin-type N-terminal cleavage/methylation domain-containing protein [bacterium]
MKKHKAFTLIELLIVVAIIGILAAIAVPNFMNAQIRAKIARVQSDLRAFGTAMEAYSLDYNDYPWGSFPNDAGGYTTGSLIGLTTPTPYMSSVSQVDSFGEGNWNTDSNAPTNKKFYVYVSYNGCWAKGDGSAQSYFGSRSYFKGYGMTSFGPDRLDTGGVWAPLWSKVGDTKTANSALYAPSNGLISRGDICRYGGAANMVSAGG